MKVYDRYQGSDVKLPDVVEPGRYRVLRRAILNRETELAAGDLLWSDGSGLCELDGEASRRFVQATDGEDEPARDSVIDNAVQAVVDQWQSGAVELPSPVMPAKLGEHAEPTELELELGEVLGRGHLQSIAARPRMAMRYDSELQPVSRARRLAHGAITRLASHSEDWLRREITGVVPRTLKAEVSEDDLAIYENVVFARLLDRLETVLRRRTREVEVLLRKHEQAMALANAERLDYRLRNALCSLWGLSFVENPATGRAATTTLLLLQSLLGKVRQLKRSGLYIAIPREHRIPMALRSTNVLQHDPHYRCLRPLWIMAHAAFQSQASTAPERFAVARERGDRFARYVGLLVRHALSACRLVSPSETPGQYLFGTRALSLVWNRDQWTLQLDGASAPLHFVPAWRGRGDWSTTGSRRIVFCHGTFPKVDTSLSAEPGIDGVLNPLEFYGVERIRHAVEYWLMASLLSRYPLRIVTLPTELRERVIQALGDAVNGAGRGLVLLRDVGAIGRQHIEAVALALHTNAATRQALWDVLDDAKLLATCRACGVRIPPTSFLASPGGFKAECECGHRWTLRLNQGSASHATFELVGGRRPFDEVGSLQLELKLC